MQIKKIIPFMNFVGMVVAAGVLFFMAVALADPFKKLVLYMNDINTNKTIPDWFNFISLSLPIGCIWGVFWIIFKSFEKKCIDAIFRNTKNEILNN